MWQRSQDWPAADRGGSGGSHAGAHCSWACPGATRAPHSHPTPLQHYTSATIDSSFHIVGSTSAVAACKHQKQSPACSQSMRCWHTPRQPAGEGRSAVLPAVTAASLSHPQPAGAPAGTPSPSPPLSALGAEGEGSGARKGGGLEGEESGTGKGRQGAGGGGGGVARLASRCWLGA